MSRGEVVYETHSPLDMDTQHQQQWFVLSAVVQSNGSVVIGFQYISITVQFDISFIAIAVTSKQ